MATRRREPTSPPDFPPELTLSELVEKLAAEGTERFGFDIRAAVREMATPPSADQGDVMTMLAALRHGSLIGPTSVCAVGRLVWLAEHDHHKLKAHYRDSLRMERAAANSDWAAGWDGTYNVIVQAHARLHAPAGIAPRLPARRPLCSRRQGRAARHGRRRVSRSAGGGSGDEGEGEPGKARQQHLELYPRHSALRTAFKPRGAA
jgi:hypothetical protein